MEVQKFSCRSSSTGVLALPCSMCLAELQSIKHPWICQGRSRAVLTRGRAHWQNPAGFSSSWALHCSSPAQLIIRKGEFCLTPGRVLKCSDGIESRSSSIVITLKFKSGSLTIDWQQVSSMALAFQHCRWIIFHGKLACTSGSWQELYPCMTPTSISIFHLHSFSAVWSCHRPGTEPCSNTGSIFSSATALTGALDKSSLCVLQPSQRWDKDNNSDLYHTWILNNRVQNTLLFYIEHWNSAVGSKTASPSLLSSPHKNPNK